MEILVKELRDVLELLAPAVPRKTTLPVLQNVLLEGTRARASDLEVMVSVDLGREVGDPFCIPHHQLYDLLKFTPGDTMLVLTPASQPGGMLSVKMKSGTASLVTGKAADYPPAPTIQDPKVAVLDGTALIKALGQILPYTASEESRPVLTAACVTLGDPVEVAAADGFRLAIQQIPERHLHLNGHKLLIPGHTIKVLAHLWEHASTAPELQEEDGPAQMAIGKRLLRLEYTDKLVRITFGKVTLITQLAQGTFPNYGPLIPTDLPQRASFMAGDMRQALDLVREVARGGSGIVRLSWEGEDMTVMATATEMGEVTAQVRLLVPCTAAGKIAIDVKYLVEYFKGQEGIVSMGVSSPSAPALFTTAGMPDVVMMPMFVQWDGAQPTTEEQNPAEEQPSQEPSGEPVAEDSVTAAPVAKKGRKPRKKA